MSWFYSPDDQQRIEVADAVFETLIREGKIAPHMLVWREGMGDWRPAREVKPELFDSTDARARVAVSQRGEAAEAAGSAPPPVDFSSGESLSASIGASPSQGPPPPPAPEAFPPPPPVPPAGMAHPAMMGPPVLPTEPYAMFSLISGIIAVLSALGAFCICCAHFGTVICGATAVILGHMSYSRITQHPDQVRGRELAIAGMVLGYISLALLLGGLVIMIVSVGLSGMMSALQGGLPL